MGYRLQDDNAKKLIRVHDVMLEDRMKEVSHEAEKAMSKIEDNVSDNITKVEEQAFEVVERLTRMSNLLFKSHNWEDLQNKLGNQRSTHHC